MYWKSLRLTNIGPYIALISSNLSLRIRLKASQSAKRLFSGCLGLTKISFLASFELKILLDAAVLDFGTGVNFLIRKKRTLSLSLRNDTTVLTFRSSIDRSLLKVLRKRWTDSFALL